MAIFKPTNKYSMSTFKSLWNTPSIAPQKNPIAYMGTGPVLWV